MSTKPHLSPGAIAVALPACLCLALIFWLAKPRGDAPTTAESPGASVAHPPEASGENAPTAAAIVGRPGPGAGTVKTPTVEFPAVEADADTGWTQADLGADWGRESDPALRAFSRWVIGGLESGRWGSQAEGFQLAVARREALSRLILEHPETAIRGALPPNVRDRLPAGMSDQLETFVEGTGVYRVGVACFDRQPLRAGAARHFRSFTVGGVRYRAGVYGERLATVSNDALPAHGIAIGDRIALEENAVRVVSESPDGAVVVRFGDETLSLPGAEMAVRLAARQRALEITPGIHAPATAVPAAAAPKSLALATANTIGRKKLLIIRVEFADRLGTPVDTLSGATITPAWAASAVNGGLSDLFTEFSYGKFDVTTTSSDVTPVFRMPRSSMSYRNSEDWDALATHAKDSAARSGFSLSGYHHYIIVFSEVPAISFAGLATLGARDYVLINGYFDAATVGHEIGHNLGLDHANLWITDSPGNPVGTGSSEEYGDVYDLMGSGNWRYWIPEETLHPNPHYLDKLGWLASGSIRNVTAAGTYRVHRFDTAAADAGNTLALRIFRRSGQYYWVGFRHDLAGEFSDADDMAAGAYIVAQGFNRFGNSDLIDFGTSTTDDEVDDASLNLGQTFADGAGGITIRPVQMGGAGTGKWIDIEVDLPELPEFTPVIVPAARVSGPFTLDLDASEDPRTYRIYGLPSGLVYNKTTGLITGTPNRAGTYTITAYAYNALGRGPAYQFQLVIDGMEGDRTGWFSGLMEVDPVLSQDLGGRVDLSVSTVGTYSAVVTLGREVYRLKGRGVAEIGGDFTIDRSIPRRGRFPLRMELRIQAGGTFAGTLTEMSVPADSLAFAGEKCPWEAKLLPATDFAGVFNATLDLQPGQVGLPEIPQGTGFLRIGVATSGRARWAGRTADGLAFAGGGSLWADGEMPLFQILRGGTGALRGSLEFDPATGTVSGSPEWFQKPVPSRYYAPGFGPIPVDLEGARYLAPLPGELLLGLPLVESNARIEFTAGDIGGSPRAGDLDQVFTIDASHRVRMADRAGPVNVASVSVAIDRKTGFYTGRFVLSDPDPFNPARPLARKVGFRGIFVPGQTTARGFFLLAGLGDPLAVPVVSLRNSPILSGQCTLSEP
jgi:hypothetical protein